MPVCRSMSPDSDGLPRVGRGARLLGVRVDGKHPDVAVQAGTVGPDKGMSVAPHWWCLPYWRIPARLEGTGFRNDADVEDVLAGAAGPDEDIIYVLEDVVFSDGVVVATNLRLRVDKPTHAMIAPAVPLPLADYEAAIAGTRTRWRNGEPTEERGGA